MQPKIFLFWICLLRTHYHPINENKYLHTWPLYVIQSCLIINRRNIKKDGKFIYCVISDIKYFRKWRFCTIIHSWGKFSFVLLILNLLSFDIIFFKKMDFSTEISKVIFLSCHRILYGRNILIFRLIAQTPHQKNSIVYAWNYKY